MPVCEPLKGLRTAHDPASVAGAMPGLSGAWAGCGTRRAWPAHGTAVLRTASWCPQATGTLWPLDVSNVLLQRGTTGGVQHRQFANQPPPVGEKNAGRVARRDGIFHAPGPRGHYVSLSADNSDKG